MFLNLFCLIFLSTFAYVNAFFGRADNWMMSPAEEWAITVGNWVHSIIHMANGLRCCSTCRRRASCLEKCVECNSFSMGKSLDNDQLEKYEEL
eukprot:Trichotokara_eunicae@DN6122_c0_g1_i5.p2